MQVAPRILALLVLAAASAAQLQPDWIVSQPAGNSLASGCGDVAVDAAGNSYVTGTTGSGTNTDVLTVAFDPAGNLLWSRTFNGPANKAERGRALALAPDGTLWVTGSTLNAVSVSDVLLLQYDRTNGTLLQSAPYTTSASTSESGLDLAIDAGGNLFVAATTGGDGSDTMLVSFDASGAFRWNRTWDGSAFGPFSQDVPNEVLVDPAGDVLLLVTGIGVGSLPDYVVLKYDGLTGATLWEALWGGVGTQSPVDMVVDANGDVFVTGTAIDLIDKFSTIKLAGSSGALGWQAFDSIGEDDQAFAIALDGLGGVYVTGDADPDGNDSNFNEDFFTVKRDAATGQFLWSHVYGDPCVGCFDRPTDVLVDPSGFVLVAGTTSSAPYSGAHISFVLDATTGVELDRGVIQNTPAGTGSLEFDGARNWYNGGQTKNTTTGIVSLTVTKYAAISLPCTASASATPVADAGGLNVPNSLDVVPAGNVPSLGNGGFAAAIDDPSGACGIAPGSLTFAVVGTTPTSLGVADFGCGQRPITYILRTNVWRG